MPNPTNVYGVSKLAGEIFAGNGLNEHYIVRFPTLFGPRRNDSLGFVDKMMRIMEDGKNLTVAADKIDSPTYTIDAAKQVLDLIKEKKPFGVYHVVNKGNPSYHELISELGNMMGYCGEVALGKDSDFPALAQKPLKTAMSSMKLPSMRGWKEALKDYVTQKELNYKVN